ncbi:dCTP deaminase [Methanorbis furvi]|uniref:dCTP deaminase, dUMP-forming n=1 Tax=Methanorbis furvi TaxID=3028299 RepID=A0AAE4SAS2_9EURY|nr:dCTP deaminase, dUMP-forming [Methanocorpusculaceae archaeon Ag1]
MLLSSSRIRARIADGTLGIAPFAEDSLQPASYDLRAAEDIVLKKGELSLVATMEFVSLPADLAATLRGRSSFGRKGVLLGAGYIDPGFRGNLTLCMVNMGPEDISVTKGTRIVQMLIHPILGDVETAYNGNYQDSYGIVKSKI